MRAQVHDERRGAIEALLALGACVTLLARMRTHVLSQLVGLAEALAAHGAHIRFHTRVSALVDHQVACKNDTIQFFPFI